MFEAKRRNLFAGGWACCLGVMLWALIAPARAGEPADPVNLALNRPATCSSIENDEHDAARANDGKLETCWRADDEPEGGPEWWQVDLGKDCDLAGCEITWPYDGMNYRCKVEGSVDLKKWLMLSDQTKTTSRKQVRRLDFGHDPAVRYVRVTVTGFDDGCWASLSEVKVFGSDKSH